MTEILEGASEGEEVQVIRRKKASGGGSNPFTPFGRQRQRRRTG
jgi:hypothetical protein